MASYQPLAGAASHSPALEPYRTEDDSIPGEQLSLYDSGAPLRPSSRASGDYENFRHGNTRYENLRYENGPGIESKGLISEPKYRLYRRRFFGLAELTLLNFAIGWGYAAPGVVSTTATKWYGITFEELNNLSIAGSLVFLLPAPFVIWVLNKHGPKFSIIVACFLTVVGNWIIYAGARTHNFPVNIAGTVIHSLASPFVLAAPTRYSRQWFDDRGRTFATALQSLAYPLGAGVGALTGPYMLKPLGTLNYDGQAMIIAIVFTAAAIPAPFIPKAPPSPPSAVAAANRLGVRDSLKSLFKNPTFYLQLLSFSVFAGAIDTVTAVTNQGIEPYGYPQVDAGYAIAFLIFVGIGAALIVSPILDRTKSHLIAFKIIVVIVAGAYTALPFIPQTRSAAALYAVFAVLGAGCLSIEPAVLELQTSWTHPVSPELSSVICWSGAKILGAVFTIVVGNVLALKKPAEGQPAGSLFNGLVFIAVMAWLCVPASWLNGYWIFKRPAHSKVEGTD